MSKTILVNECLEFTGGIGSHGYGVFWMNGKNYNAHKLSYMLNIGNVPDDLLVCHKCDNKKCINPNHLYLGDMKKNMQDAVDRQRIAKGERHGSKTHPESFKRSNAKFTDEQCIEIYKSKDSVSVLAKTHNTHICTIYRAKYRADELLKQLENQQP